MSQNNAPTDFGISATQYLYDLVETAGVAGHEQAVFNQIEEQLSGDVTGFSRDDMEIALP